MKTTKIVLCVLISVILIFGCTACGNNKPAIDSTTPETNINSSSQLEYLTENVALFNSNSGAIYTYTLKKFNDRINKRLGTELFDYSKWEKRDLQTQEKSGIEFVSYTYDILTGNSPTGMIEVLAEKDSNYVLGINIGIDSNADNGKAAPTAITWVLLGCDSEIDDNAVNTILTRFLDNLKNGKYEMFCYNNSSFELYKENGMIMVSILPISDSKIKENNLPVIEPLNMSTDIDSEQNDNELESTETFKESEGLLETKDYSNYINSWIGYSNNISYSLNIETIIDNYIEGALFVYDETTMGSANIIFSGNILDNTLAYSYADDGVGNSGTFYITFEEDSILLSNLESGYNTESVFHWSTYDNIILSR